MLEWVIQKLNQFFHLWKQIFLDLIEASIEGKLSEKTVKFKDEVCVNVVMASKGYPASYESNKGISF